MYLNKEKKPSSNIFIYAGAAIVGLLSIFLFVMWSMFTHSVTVEPGFEVVLVDKPYIFGHEGVRKETLKEGRKLVFDSTSNHEVRMTPQSISVKVDDFSSADNILLDFESTIQYRILDPVDLISNFGEGWFVNNVVQPYLSEVREAIKKKTMTEMMSDVNAAKTVDDAVTAGLISIVKNANLKIQIIGVNMGRAKPNVEVLAQMNETAAQQQRKKTLIEAQAAEVQRKLEQQAKADADNAYRNSIGMSAEQFIQLESIKRYADACARATGCIVTTTGQSPVVSLPKK